MPLTELVAWFNREQRRQYGQLVHTDTPLRTSGHEVTGVYAGFTLRSEFQAIFDSRTGHPVAFEALLRATTAQRTPVTPASVFSVPSSAEEVIYLDRLCRTLHALNFLLQGGEQKAVLTLNVHPRHVAAVNTDHGQAFESVLSQCGLSPSGIVLELSSRALHRPEHLIDAVANYRQRGYQIALDGVRQVPDISHLQALQPDWVKFDPTISELSHNKLRVLLDSAREGLNQPAKQVVLGLSPSPLNRSIVELVQANMAAPAQPRLHTRCLPDVPVDARVAGAIRYA
ncbi:EAL domain-containing protein [Alcanivorax hongdengensis A-11-3]|uniref:EAL domain-containing protein n=1 Tax=Alcanivorax hongdengensis A-11-3 TaxID=1177179 RepID=L0WG93_9GAMM|nr:EAL domain-containing protein [Alcanivorax hongdengensis]EKF76026.1 EAL domain-containing protein [Alcanivorax hongdengensis A-11-3]